MQLKINKQKLYSFLQLVLRKNYWSQTTSPSSVTYWVPSGQLYNLRFSFLFWENRRVIAPPLWSCWGY
jgi:hypothetical protein